MQVHDTVKYTTMPSSRNSSPSRKSAIPTRSDWLAARKTTGKARKAHLLKERITVVKFLNGGGKELVLQHQISEFLKNELHRAGYTFTKIAGSITSNYVYIFF